jgi:hypothetical protein
MLRTHPRACGPRHIYQPSRRGCQGFPRRAFLGWFGAHFIQNCDYHVWARLRCDFDPISPFPGQDWTTDAGLGALSTRLARRRRARQRDCYDALGFDRELQVRSRNRRNRTAALKARNLRHRRGSQTPRWCHRQSASLCGLGEQQPPGRRLSAGAASERQACLLRRTRREASREGHRRDRSRSSGSSGCRISQQCSTIHFSASTWERKLPKCRGGQSGTLFQRANSLTV